MVWVDIEGIPMNAWTRNMFLKIGMRWGETLDIEETYDSTFARKRLCIKTNLSYNILECFKVISRGKIYMVRAKELFTWTPQFRIFKNTDYMSDEDSPVDVGHKQSDPVMSDEEDAEGSDDEEVPNTDVGEELLKPDNNIPNDNSTTGKQISDDSFGVYELLNKPRKCTSAEEDVSIPYPLVLL